jgi:beta-N-acetylhexosaminidase
MVADVPPGASAQGRALVAHVRGAAGAPVRVLVVGGVHGDEPGGRRVTQALLERPVPGGVRLTVVNDLNPDGSARGTRQDARGVDLNRNFPHRWRAAGARGDRFWPGPRAASERETRWAMRLIRSERPDLTVWLHQPYGIVVPGAGSDATLVRRYARTAQLPVRRLPAYRGTAAGWENATLRNGGALVVELRGGPVGDAVVRRQVAAIDDVAALVRARKAHAARARAAAAAPRPPIVWTPIPYGAQRKAQMRRYARRHAGVDTYLLRDPKVIVEHFTASNSFRSAFETFAANRPDLGELPGTCAHFVIDRDGTIHQLVPLRLMCRHVVGLNDTAIGIEHVGTSDGAVMGNRRQLDASLRLTRWLQAREGIRLGDVIGHAESLSSPYHHERVPSWRHLTHADFQPATMRRYRALLRG